jgi:hypothetical protein
MELIMIGRATDVPSVTLSVRLYRLFLIVYPKSFRREYGPQMLQVFRDYSIHTYKRRGPSGMLSLWALTLLDLLRSMVEQHLQRETFMSKNTLIRLSGWAMAIGGATSAIGFMSLILDETTGSWRGWVTLEDLLVIAFFVGPIGAGLGLLGLRARFGESIGPLGSNVLLLGAIVGIPLVVIGDIVQAIPNSLGDNGFWIFSVGLFAIFVGLELYGILALRKKPQSRWNGLAAVAGLPVSLAGVIVAATGPTTTNDTVLAVAYPFIALFAVMAVALVMLGYLVQADLPEELTAEPANA